jgi:DNA-binding SARP family transcriptional activator
LRPDRDRRAAARGAVTAGPHPEAWSGLDGATVLAQAPFGVLVFDRWGRLAGHNPASEHLLGPLRGHRGEGAVRCCDLLGCRRPGSALEGRCVLELVREADAALPEIRIDLDPDREPGALWITMAPLDDGQMIVTLRPGEHGDRRRRTNPHWIAGPRLRVAALGRTRVASAETPLGGQWIQQRPGQVFKYLLIHRERLVPIDELAETFWPGGVEPALHNAHYFVHVVRNYLEPGRPKRRPSAFILAERGGYRLDTDRVELDVDRFESLVAAGLAAAARGDAGAHPLLVRAIELYRGDFMADEAYAEWTFAERDRLRSRVGEALRALAAMALDADDLAAAAGHLARLAELEPFDVPVHRDLLELQLRRGRHSEAKRHYFSLRARMRQHFAEDLDFTLAELVERRGS